MTKVTKKVETHFLQLVATGMPVMHACKAVGVARKTLYARRDKYEDFADAWADALEDGRLTKVALLEDEADRRAIDGFPEPVFYQGHECGEKMRYSDTLLLARLKALDPEKYGDKAKHEHSGNVGIAGSVVVPGQMVPESWEKAASDFDRLGPPPMPEDAAEGLSDADR